MPFIIASFKENDRRNLARGVCVLNGFGASLSLIVGAYTMILMQRFYAEMYYFVHIQSSSALSKSKGGGHSAWTYLIFGYFIFIVLIFCAAHVATFFVFWLNADELRRMKRVQFDKCMATMTVVFVILSVMGFISDILMSVSSIYLEDLLIAGVRRAMKNYDATSLASFALDKPMLDKLQLNNQCCGEDGWMSFQVPEYHLNILTQILKKNKNGTKCNVKEFCYVPWSCCVRTASMCSNQLFELPLEDPVHYLTLNGKGCVEALAENVIPGLDKLTGVCAFYCLIFITNFVLTRWFHTSCLVVFDHHIPVTPGWVLQGGDLTKQELIDIYMKMMDNKIALYLAQQAAMAQEQAAQQSVMQNEALEQEQFMKKQQRTTTAGSARRPGRDTTVGTERLGESEAESETERSKASAANVKRKR